MPRRRNRQADRGERGEPPIRHYRMVTGHGRYITQTVITQEERAKLTMDGRDFHYDHGSGDMYIRLASGETKDFHGNCPLGPETYSLLEKILMAASDFVPLVSDDWQYAQISRTRALFEDPPGRDYFFQVRRYPDYAIRLKPEIRWRIITVWQANNS